MQSGSANFYHVMFRPADGQIRLYKFVSGAATQLGSSYSFTVTANQVYNLELRMSSSTISAHLDSTQRISTTDTDITSAGKAGIFLFRMRETGVDDRGRLEEFSAVDAAPAYTYTLGTPTYVPGSITSSGFRPRIPVTVA